MPDVITCGEALIDFVSTVPGASLVDVPAFERAAGGAPANVAVGLAKLGVSSAFMGKVGDDPFGHFLSRTFAENGVDVSALRFSTEARTMLAFVSLSSEGERDFMFYRHPSADMLYSPDDLDPGYIRSAKVFHFGSISLISEPSRSATYEGIEIARNGGSRVSFDPNLRLGLWPSLEAAKREIMEAWPLCHIIKLSEEELEFLVDGAAGDTEERVRSLWHEALSLLVVTNGARGCSAFTHDFGVNVPGFRVPVRDTTGAGDGFMAGLLKGVVERHLDTAKRDELAELCRYANAAGAITVTRRGAIPALPDDRQVTELLRGTAPERLT